MKAIQNPILVVDMRKEGQLTTNSPKSDFSFETTLMHGDQLVKVCSPLVTPWAKASSVRISIQLMFFIAVSAWSMFKSSPSQNKSRFFLLVLNQVDLSAFSLLPCFVIDSFGNDAYSDIASFTSDAS